LIERQTHAVFVVLAEVGNAARQRPGMTDLDDGFSWRRRFNRDRSTSFSLPQAARTTTVMAARAK